MKVMLVNAHSTLNPGDAAIVLSNIKRMREIDKSVEIVMTSRTPDYDKDFFAPYNVKIIECFIPSMNVGGDHKIVGFLRSLCSIKSKTNFIRELRSCDCVCSVGGGYMYSDSTYFPGPTFIQVLAHVIVPVMYGKPVVICSQSFGPFRSSPSKALVKKVLKNVNVKKVFVREDISKRYLEHILLDDAMRKVEFCPDIAFYCDKEDAKSAREMISDLKRPVFCFTLRQWHFPESTLERDKTVLMQRYKEVLIDYAQWLVKRYNGSVFIFPQVMGPSISEDDRIISRRFYEKLKSTLPADCLRLYEEDRVMTPAEIRSFFSKMDMLIGTRFHSCIFAMTAGVPFISVGYAHKSWGMLERLNMTDYSMKMSDVTSDKLIALTEHIFSRKKRIIEKLVLQMKEIRSEIKDKFLKMWDDCMVVR